MNKHGVKSSANSLRNLAGMLSGPATFDGSRSCKSLVIPEACKSIFYGCLVDLLSKNAVLRVTAL